MGRDNSLSFNTGTIVNPFEGLQRGLTGVGNIMETRQLAADKQKALDLEAARQQVLDERYAVQAEWDAKAHTQQESEWKTANDKAANALLVKQRVDALNANYMPSANDSIKGVEDYINNQSAADVESGKAFGKVDGTTEQQAQHAKFIDATTKAYDAAAPTQEQAYAEMSGKYMAAGASPTDADALAKLKVTGLQSSKEQQAAAQKLADDTLTQAKWMYEQKAKQRGEEVSALAKSFKSGTSGGGSGGNSATGGNVLGALTKAGIKDDEAQTVVGEIARFKAEEGYTDSQIAPAIPLAAEEAGWVSDPDIQTKMLKNIVRQNYGVRSVDTNGNETWAAAKGSGDSKYNTALADINSRYAALQTLPSMQSPVSSAKTADQIKAEFLKNYTGDTTKIGGVVDGVPGHADTNSNREKALNSAADNHAKAMVSKQDMAMYVADAAKATGLSGDVIQSIIGKESGGDANASNPNSSASGLGQFTNATKADMIKQFGKSYGLTEDNFNDPKNNVLATSLLLTKNTDAYIREYGKQPTPGEQYGMHFLGFGGFSKFNKALSEDPSTSIAEVVSADTMKSNPNLYGSDKKPLTVGAVQASFNKKMPAAAAPTTSAEVLSRIRQIDYQTGITTDPAEQKQLLAERIALSKQAGVIDTTQRQRKADEAKNSMLLRLSGRQIVTDEGIKVAEVPAEKIDAAQTAIQQPSTSVGTKGTTSIINSIRGNYEAGAPDSKALTMFNKYALGDEVPQPLKSKEYARIGQDELAIRNQIGTNNPRETWETMYRLSESPRDKEMFGKLLQYEKYNNNADYRRDTQMSSAMHVAGNTLINAGGGGPILRGAGKLVGTAIEYAGKLVPGKAVSNVGEAITKYSTANAPVGFGQSTTAGLTTKTGVADQAAYDATAKEIVKEQQILARTKNIDKRALREESIAAKEKILKDTPQVTSVVTKSGGEFRPDASTLDILTKGGRPSREVQAEIDFIVNSMGLQTKAAAKTALKKKLAGDAAYRQKLYTNALKRTVGTTMYTSSDQLSK